MDTKKYLRELAKKQLEYANLPIMKEREKEWYLHNSLKGNHPMVVMEEASFLNEIINPICDGEFERYIETQLLQNIASYELINDDKVVPNFFKVAVKLDMILFGVEKKRIYANEGLGYHDEPVIEDLAEDLEKLSASTFTYNKEWTQNLADLSNNIFGDILPVKYVNEQNHWHFGITQRVVDLMGMENMFCSMYDYPDEFHKLMQFIVDDNKRFLRWQEDNELIFLNNGNDYMGSGSYCFNNELTGNGKVKSTDTWGHLNSQETVGVNPKMFDEFIYPYYSQMAEQFGLLYYGCCEPVHDFWDNIIKLKNLRKVSISPWCNEEFMAQQLSNSRIIYSRKPSPNFIGVEKNFDEQAFKDYINKTKSLTKDCKTEYIFRDIYKLYGNLDKLKKAVEIVRG